MLFAISAWQNQRVPPDPTAEIHAAGDAYDAWLAALREAGEWIRSADAPGTALDRAEGVRYLTRLASTALSMFVENADPLHPALYVNADAHHKYGVDNPDNVYLRCAVIDVLEILRRAGEFAFCVPDLVIPARLEFVRGPLELPQTFTEGFPKLGKLLRTENQERNNEDNEKLLKAKLAHEKSSKIKVPIHHSGTGEIASTQSSPIESVLWVVIYTK